MLLTSLLFHKLGLYHTENKIIQEEADNSLSMNFLTLKRSYMSIRVGTVSSGGKAYCNSKT